MDVAANASCHGDSVCAFPWNTAKGLLGMLLYLFMGLKWFLDTLKVQKPYGIPQRLLIKIRTNFLGVMAKHQENWYHHNAAQGMSTRLRLILI